MNNIQVLKKMYNELIRRQIPKAQKIVIDVNLTNEHTYESKIKVICKGKIYWARKTGGTIHQSLRSATHSIANQLTPSHQRRVKYA